MVAEEVRNLAARSAKAAQETAELIEGSVEKTRNGSADCRTEPQSPWSRSSAAVTKVTDLVAEIAAASNEQAQGITQVNEGMEQIDQVTQQNTANAEESAAAAEELSSQATQLQEMLARFTFRRPKPGAAAKTGICRAAGRCCESGHDGTQNQTAAADERHRFGRCRIRPILTRQGAEGGVPPFSFSEGDVESDIGFDTESAGWIVRPPVSSNYLIFFCGSRRSSRFLQSRSHDPNYRKICGKRSYIVLVVQEKLPELHEE